MARVDDQNIPSGLADAYADTLGTQEWLPGETKVGRRYPFRVRGMQGCRTIRPPIIRGASVSDNMCANRQVWGKCVKCWNKQPATGGAEPPDPGPRARTWWFTDAIASGLWYFNYFMRQTFNAAIGGDPVAWCTNPIQDAVMINSGNPNQNYSGSTNSQLMHSSTQNREVLIHGLEEGWSKIWLYMGNAPPYPPITGDTVLRSYELLEDWSKNSVTWNNQPAVGRQLGYGIFDTTPLQWVAVSTGGKKNLLIRVKEETEAAWTTLNENAVPPWDEFITKFGA